LSTRAASEYSQILLHEATTGTVSLKKVLPGYREYWSRQVPGCRWLCIRGHANFRGPLSCLEFQMAFSNGNGLREIHIPVHLPLWESIELVPRMLIRIPLHGAVALGLTYCPVLLPRGISPPGGRRRLLAITLYDRAGWGGDDWHISRCTRPLVSHRAAANRLHVIQRKADLVPSRFNFPSPFGFRSWSKRPC
jgi:hypothetical protein